MLMYNTGCTAFFIFLESFPGFSNTASSSSFHITVTFPALSYQPLLWLKALAVVSYPKIFVHSDFYFHIEALFLGICFPGHLLFYSFQFMDTFFLSCSRFPPRHFSFVWFTYLPLAPLPVSHCLGCSYLFPVLAHLSNYIFCLRHQTEDHIHVRPVTFPPRIYSLLYCSLFNWVLFQYKWLFPYSWLSIIPSHFTCLYWFRPRENCHFIAFFFLPYLGLHFPFYSKSCSVVLSQKQTFISCSVPLNSSLASMTQF